MGIICDYHYRLYKVNINQWLSAHNLYYVKEKKENTENLPCSLDITPPFLL